MPAPMNFFALIQLSTPKFLILLLLNIAMAKAAPAALLESDLAPHGKVAATGYNPLFATKAGYGLCDSASRQMTPGLYFSDLTAFNVKTPVPKDMFYIYGQGRAFKLGITTFTLCQNWCYFVHNVNNSCDAFSISGCSTPGCNGQCILYNNNGVAGSKWKAVNTGVGDVQCYVLNSDDITEYGPTYCAMSIATGKKTCPMGAACDPANSAIPPCAPGLGCGKTAASTSTGQGNPYFCANVTTQGFPFVPA